MDWDSSVHSIDGRPVSEQSAGAGGTETSAAASSAIFCDSLEPQRQKKESPTVSRVVDPRDLRIQLPLLERPE